MANNNVFKLSPEATGLWLQKAGIRALKTFAQTAVSLITVGNIVTELDWVSIIGISATSAIVSILTSIAGIPEVTDKEK